MKKFTLCLSLSILLSVSCFAQKNNLPCQEECLMGQDEYTRDQIQYLLSKIQIQKDYRANSERTKSVVQYFETYHFLFSKLKIFFRDFSKYQQCLVMECSKDNFPSYFEEQDLIKNCSEEAILFLKQLKRVASASCGQIYFKSGMKIPQDIWYCIQNNKTWELFESMKDLNNCSKTYQIIDKSEYLFELFLRSFIAMIEQQLL